MNIHGDEAKYIQGVIFNFVSMSAEDLLGMVFNRTLYFLENWSILYEIELPEYFSPDLVCCFWRNVDNPGSFAYDNSIIDKPDLFPIMSAKLDILKYTSTNPIFVDDNCLDDPQFDALSKYRPSDGSMKYYIDSALSFRSFTMVNKSFFKLNKGDKLSLNVYQVDNNRILYKFILFKKKFNRNINIYTLTLGLH